MKYRLPLMIVVSACVGFLLTSCNTWVGLGRDVQKLGQGTEKLGRGMESRAYKGQQYSESDPYVDPAE